MLEGKGMSTKELLIKDGIYVWVLSLIKEISVEVL